MKKRDPLEKNPRERGGERGGEREKRRVMQTREDMEAELVDLPRTDPV